MNKIITLIFVAFLFLQIVDTAAIDYTWTGKAAGCTDGGSTVCDFDDADNWSVTPSGETPAPKDNANNYDIIFPASTNYTILASNPTGYKIDNLYIQASASPGKKRFNPLGGGIKLTIQGENNPDITNLYLGANCKLVLDINVKVAYAVGNMGMYSDAQFEIKKSFSTTSNWYIEPGSGNPQIIIHEGATYNYDGTQNPFQVNQHGIDWTLAGTLNAPYSDICEAPKGTNPPINIKYQGLHALVDCLGFFTQYSVAAEGTSTNPAEVTVKNYVQDQFYTSADVYNTVNLYVNPGIYTYRYQTANGGKIRLYTNETLLFEMNSELAVDLGGIIEIHGNILGGYQLPTPPSTSKRGGSSSLEIYQGRIEIHGDYKTAANYRVQMLNKTSSEVYFYGNVDGSEVPFEFIALGYVEIHKNYTNERLESLDSAAFVINNGHINTQYPTKFVGGSLLVTGATFNQDMYLDTVSFTGYATIDGNLKVNNSLTPEDVVTVSIDAGQLLTINGNLDVDKANISVYATSNTDTGYVVVNGNVSFSSSSFKFSFNDVPPATSKVYKLLTYTGTATGIPQSLSLPTVAGGSLVYEHDTTSTPKQVTLTYTPPPPSEPVSEPVSEPTNGGPTNNPPQPPTSTNPEATGSASRFTISFSFYAVVLVLIFVAMMF